MTLVINLFAGPGAGKSTTAAGLFYELKKKGKLVELVTEFAKDMVWEERHSVFEDQLYILAKQNRRLKRLQGKVDYVITDSPLLLGQYYTREDKTELTYLINWAFNKYNNLNIFINRTKPYVQTGRNENYREALNADRGIKELLKEYEYVELIDNEQIIPEICRLLIAR